MDLATLLDSLRLDRGFMANVAAWERLPARPAHYAPIPAGLDARLADLLAARGLNPIYTHQSQAIAAHLRGEHVVIVSGTASGKSLAYQVAALQASLSDSHATALFLFPTRALAQDQAIALAELVDALETQPRIAVNVYDGDTPQSQRTRIRTAGGVLISNPDMLHTGILPAHSRWVPFFQNLRLVVIDELHSYRGVFGSHVANVLRRLKRICQFYGSEPLFICASATIANPQEHAQRLIAAPVTLVDEDGSPRGEKHIILYNPPMLDPKLGIRRSYLLESRDLAARLLGSGTQTILFAGSRLGAEVLLGYLRDATRPEGLSTEQVRGYRGGYLAEERRAIEQGLRDGSVRGVVATNALELGVDIGALGAALLAGFPGTLASTWQQFGRAGRRAGVSAGLLVASGAPLDQYIAMHPAYLFERSAEHALINPDNLVILLNHLRCAAFELPFMQGESLGESEEAQRLLGLLVEMQEVYQSGGMLRWTAGGYPASDISLRTGTNDRIVIQEISSAGPRTIGEIDRHSAPLMIYEGAIYLHEGRAYLIEHLDWVQGLAAARPTEVDYYTRSATATEIEVLEEFASALTGDCIKATGRLKVTVRATGYKRIRRYTHEQLGFGPIDLPPQEWETTGYWMALTPDAMTALADEGLILLPNDYGPNWAEQREKARARDGYRCQHCGATESAGRQHDVHHLRPFREFGYRKGENEAYHEANELGNLITLCRSCHRQAELNLGARSALSGMRNVLHNLAALYLMCAPDDIGVVAEQRSPHSGTAAITFYDGAAGGLDLALRLYDLHQELLLAAHDLVRGCPCEEGCPACVGPVGEIGAGAKHLTLRLLEALIPRPDDAEASTW